MVPFGPDKNRCVFDQWLRGVEWNIKNSVLLTENDIAAFRKVEARFDEWYKNLDPKQKKSVDAIINSMMISLRVMGPNAQIKFVDVPF